jgi:hypothetical protein
VIQTDIPGGHCSRGYTRLRAGSPQSPARDHHCSRTTLLVARSQRRPTLRSTCCVEIGANEGLHRLRRAAVTARVLDYFCVSAIEDVMIPVYRRFDKAYIAGFAEQAAECARQGDQVALGLFRQAATDLAAQVKVVDLRLAHRLMAARARRYRLSAVVRSSSPRTVKM